MNHLYQREGFTYITPHFYAYLTSRDLFINESYVIAPCSVKQGSGSVSSHMTYVVEQLFTKVQLNKAVSEQECPVISTTSNFFAVAPS